MTKKNLAELLGYVNQIRALFGEMPLNVLLPGEQGRAASCPLANSLTGKVKVLVQDGAVIMFEDKADAMKVVKAGLGEAIGGYPGRFDVQLTGRCGKLFERFVDQFDNGNRHLTKAFSVR